MGDATCKVEACLYPKHARGLCATHNWRMKRYGTTDKPIRQTRPAADRFWGKVDASGDCWTWTASQAGGGYGWFASAKGRSTPAHRWSYEHLVGPVPDGLDLDHLCRNRACVRPDHLEPVTRRTNLLRGNTLPAKNAGKTHCSKGHEFIEENTYVDRLGKRHCRACRAVAARKAEDKRKGRRRRGR